MKKTIFAFISIVILSSNAVSACTGWSGLPGEGPAPEAYCWEVATFKSYVSIKDANGNLLGYSNVEEPIVDKLSTSEDHNGIVEYQGSNYAGNISKVDVYGYPQNTPDVLLKYQHGQLIGTQNIVNEYNILNGTRYWFYIPLANSSEMFSYNGTMTVKDYADVKRSLYIK